MTQAISDTARRTVGIDGKQGRPSALHVGQVDASVGTDKSMCGFADDQLTSTTQNAHRFLLNKRLVTQRIVGVDGDEAILGFRDDLLGDHHDIAIVQRRVVS